MACELEEAVGHIVSAIRKPRDMLACAQFISFFVCSPGPQPMDWLHSSALPTLINLPNPSRACLEAYLPGDCVSPQTGSLTLTLPNTGQGAGYVEKLAYFTAHPTRQTRTDFPRGMVPVAILRPGPVTPHRNHILMPIVSAPPSSSVTHSVAVCFLPLWELR